MENDMNNNNKNKIEMRDVNFPKYNMTREELDKFIVWVEDRVEMHYDDLSNGEEFKWETLTGKHEGIIYRIENNDRIEYTVNNYGYPDLIRFFSEKIINADELREKTHIMRVSGKDVYTFVHFNNIKTAINSDMACLVPCIDNDTGKQEWAFCLVGKDPEAKMNFFSPVGFLVPDSARRISLVEHIGDTYKYYGEPGKLKKTYEEAGFISMHFHRNDIEARALMDGIMLTDEQLDEVIEYINKNKSADAGINNAVIDYAIKAVVSESLRNDGEVDPNVEGPMGPDEFNAVMRELNEFCDEVQELNTGLDLSTPGFFPDSEKGESEDPTEDNDDGIMGDDMGPFNL